MSNCLPVAPDKLPPRPDLGRSKATVERCRPGWNVSFTDMDVSAPIEVCSGGGSLDRKLDCLCHAHGDV